MLIFHAVTYLLLEMINCAYEILFYASQQSKNNEKTDRTRTFIIQLGKYAKLLIYDLKLCGSLWVIL